MTISERIFERLRQIDMTQKEFSEETGILVSGFNKLDKTHMDRILGYVAVFTGMMEGKIK